MDRSAIGLAMGFLLGGNTLGGLSGRLGAAAIADAGGWRWALAVLGLVSLASAAAFAFALPKERRAPPKTRGAPFLPAIRMHCGDPGLRYLFGLGFLLMGILVVTHNYMGFRLEAPPFSLSQTAIGFVYSIYLVGAVASAAMGELAGRFGRRRVVGPAIAFMPTGVILTLPDKLWLMIAGVGVVTVGFFASHSIASIWVGLRAETAKAQVSALYLFFYYAGGSVTGMVAGWVFAVLKWPGVGCLCRRNVRPCAPDRDQANARSPDGASQPEAEKGAR